MRPTYRGFSKHAPNPVVCGRKFCSRCGRWRQTCDFHVHRRWPNGSARDFQTWCMACTRTAARERYGWKPRAVLPPMTDAQKLARVNALALARYHERMAGEPGYRETRNEYERIYRTAKRRERGIQARVYHHHPTVVDRAERIMLDPEPLLAELRLRNGEWGLIAERAGLQGRTVHRLLHGESAHVRLDVADKLAVALGIPLSILYPNER
jgi:hypothetical protein